jgi:DNA-binding winged helix-turn-helix (wHTH) protein/tetratricopeptide (TPR) repeat protein
MEMQHSKRCYRFDGFFLDVQEHHLWEGERNIYLRPKTFDLLIYLVEHCGRLVTKNDLLDTLWQDVEVTENALAHCVTELRDVFKDDKKNPRFIETIQRVGYRFIATVEQKEDPENGEEYEEELSAVSVAVIEEDTETENDSSSGKPSQLITPVMAALTAGAHQPASLFQRCRRRLWGIVAVTAVLILLLFTYWSLHRRTTLAFSERDWILIADFDNFTGQSVFDAALRTALERELSHSHFLNVVPPGRVIDTLRLMKNNLDTRVTEGVGRDICLRDGNIRALLCGNIHQVVETYTIALQLIDPPTGVHVAVLEEQAPSRQELLPAIGRLARALRQQLGEPSNLLSTISTPLERATTSSLEALTLYSKGLVLMDQFSWGEAGTYFDQAIVSDPEFASAYCLRGVSNFMVGKDSSTDLQRALILSRTASLRERLFIQSIEAFVNQMDVLKAINFCESLLQQFPDDYWAHEYLSWWYFYAGNYPRWQEHQAACQRIRPNSPQPIFHAGWVSLLYEGNAESADAKFMRVLELKPDFNSFLVQGSKGYLHWMRGEMEQASAEFATFRTAKMGKISLYFQISAHCSLARFYLLAGRSDEALMMLETNRDITFPITSADLAKHFPFERAVFYQQTGKWGKFERLMNEDVQSKIGIQRVEALGYWAIVKARAGQAAAARALQREIEKENRMPQVDLWHPPLKDQLELAKMSFGLQIDGEILLKNKQTNEALLRFQDVIKMVPDRNALFNTMLTPMIYLLAQHSTANAYIQRGDWDGAARAYKAILQHKSLCIGTAGASAIWVEALKSIGPALEKAGRVAEAANYREEYRRLRPPSL